MLAHPLLEACEGGLAVADVVAGVAGVGRQEARPIREGPLGRHKVRCAQPRGRRDCVGGRDGRRHPHVRRRQEVVGPGRQAGRVAAGVAGDAVTSAGSLQVVPGTAKKKDCQFCLTARL